MRYSINGVVNVNRAILVQYRQDSLDYSLQTQQAPKISTHVKRLELNMQQEHLNNEFENLPVMTD